MQDWGELPPRGREAALPARNDRVLLGGKKQRQEGPRSKLAAAERGREGVRGTQHPRSPAAEGVLVRLG